MAELTYRPAIDGLRGIAVLSVIVFHIHAGLLPGGFVGVDLFFVLSGFLISRNILREIEEGRFSLADFYRRRIKRIVPALLVVLVATVVAAQWFLMPKDAEAAAEAGLWSLASLANVYFWLREDMAYFAASSAEKPLLHLWSLGVEEQFYLLWPLVLMAASAVRRKGLLVAILLALAASFAAATWLFPAEPSFTYYMLPTRAGELLMGAAAALLVLKWPPLLGRAGATAAATAGAMLLAGSFLFIDERVPFPGWAAVPPTLGAALLIYADHCQPNWTSRLLCWRPLRAVGFVSYSAYLWHWPLLAFWRYGYRQVGVVSGIALFVATFVLAWLTYRWVETPARRSKASVVRVLLTQFAAPGAAIAALCLVAMKLDGYTFRPAELAAMKPSYKFDYVCQRKRLGEADLSDPACVTGAKAARPTVLLWGDSNAAHYVGMVSVFADRAGLAVRNVSIDACPPLDADPAGLVNARRLDDCRHSLALVKPMVAAYPVVVLAGSWTGYDAAALQAVMATASRLAKEGHLVILLGKSPVIATYDWNCPLKVRAFPGASCPTAGIRNAASVGEVNATLEAFSRRTEGVRFFDVSDTLCPGGLCRLTNAGGEPVYLDSSHITMHTSWELGRELSAQQVPEPFMAAARWAAGR